MGEQRACPHFRLQTFAFLSGMPGKRIHIRKTALSANPSNSRLFLKSVKARQGFAVNALIHTTQVDSI
jgi:hypothetical protein